MKKGKLFIELGIDLQMPEGEEKTLCPECEKVHNGECEDRLHDEEEVVDDKAAEVLGTSMEGLKKMLGRDSWSGTSPDSKKAEEDNEES